jgi:hypothetical protein
MYETVYGEALADWLKEHQEREDGTHLDLQENTERKIKYPFYAMWGGNPPDVKYYQTKKYIEEDLTHIQLYENTSEGTPISPVFAKEDFKKLCEYAAENCSTFADFKATKEQWMKMLGDGLVIHQEGNFIFM